MARAPEPPSAPALPPRARAAAWLLRTWQSRGAASTLLQPLAWLHGAVTGARRWLYAQGWLATHRLPVPVVVVGNVIAGGAGKTPTVIAIVSALRAAGRTPGIVSRGYGRASTERVHVEPDTEPARAGDEPLLLRRRTGVPVVVDADRVGAAHALLQAEPAVDVIVADDGLQHLALDRDVEVVVFDERGAGNGRLLPAGPLREPIARVLPAQGSTGRPVRLVLYNAPAPSLDRPGWTAGRRLSALSPLADWRRGAAPEPSAWSALQGRPVLAVAGVAVPTRFFDALRAHGLDVEPLPLDDHHDYAVLPWSSTAGDVVVTEKDAVKLDPARVLGARVWVATLDFEPEAGFVEALLGALPAPAGKPDAGASSRADRPRADRPREDRPREDPDHGHPPA